MLTERGPVEQALEELWPEARRRLWRRPRYWLRSWRLLRHYQLRPLRLQDVRVRVPQGVVPDCEACEEVCCTGRHRVVSMRLRDIAAFLDAGLQEHITQRRPEFSVEELAGNSALYESVHSDLWKWFPVVRQDRTGTCGLLDEELRCAAHPAWPLSCARFPYSLNLLEGTVFFARSCGSSRLVRGDEAPGQVRALVEATLEAYNQRIRDLVLVHVAVGELDALGILPYLNLPRWALKRR